MTRQQQRYVRQIQECDRRQLKTLWNEILNGQVDSSLWPQGKALEYLVLRGFQLDDAHVIWPRKVWHERKNIEENDGIIYYQHWSCIVECKDTDKHVNYEPIAKLRSKLMRRPSHTIACIFSSSGYTEECLKLCEYNAPQTILRWEPSEITSDLENGGDFCRRLLTKYRIFVEEGFQKSQSAKYTL
jgi:hypothetical protein